MNSQSNARASQPRQRGLARRPAAPTGSSNAACRFEREPQRLARAEQMRLADDLVERRAAAALGQRRRRLALFEQVASRRGALGAAAADFADRRPRPWAA